MTRKKTLPGDDGKKTLPGDDAKWIAGSSPAMTRKNKMPGRTIKQSIANFLTKKTGCFQPVFLFFTNQLFIL